jgi:thioredoxin reductase (NADPH)
MPNVTVYTSNGCSYCTRLKEWLSERNIAFEERNISENKAYYDELTNQGLFTSPVAIIDGTPVVGFRPNKMSEILGVK